MTQAETLIALAERVEALEGPDRDIDAKIARAFGWSTILAQKDTWWRPPAGVNLSLSSDPPRYTRSLDAAMSLVPEGCLWTLDSIQGPLWTAGIWRPQTGWVIYPHDQTKTATPALALTAASLRARAASLGEG